MTLPASGQISINDIRLEMGLAGGNYSLKDLSTIGINPCSTSKPDGLAPYTISKFYGYNHSAVCPSPSATVTPSLSVSSSVPSTPSLTPTITPSISVSPSFGASVSVTPSLTPTHTPSNTPPSSPVATPSVTPSLTATPPNSPPNSPIATPSVTITPSTSHGASASVTPSLSVSSSLTPTVTPSLSVSSSLTPTVTPSLSVSSSFVPDTPSVTPSKTPTVTPSLSVSNSPAPISPSVTPTPSLSPPPASPTPTPSNWCINLGAITGPAIDEATVCTYNYAANYELYYDGSQYHTDAGCTAVPSAGYYLKDWATPGKQWIHFDGGGNSLGSGTCSVPSPSLSVTPTVTPGATPSPSPTPLPYSFTIYDSGGVCSGTGTSYTVWSANHSSFYNGDTLYTDAYNMIPFNGEAIDWYCVTCGAKANISAGGVVSSIVGC